MASTQGTVQRCREQERIARISHSPRQPGRAPSRAAPASSQSDSMSTSMISGTGGLAAVSSGLVPFWSAACAG